MAFNINQFISNALPLGGARPSLFDVTIKFPQGQAFGTQFQVNGEPKIRFVCRSASIPPSIINSIDVPYFGRRVKVSGERVYPDWDVTIFNDEDYTIRRAFEEWHAAINRVIDNVKAAAQPGEAAPTGYKGTALVTHYSKTGAPINNYTFVNIFPTLVDQMQLDWEATGTIQTFGVRFAYDYWLPGVSAGSRTSGQFF